MKNICKFLLWLVCTSGYSQNLVPNPSFEDNIFCPFGLNQFEACSDWKNFGNSPDYYNSCATNGLNVPNAVFGFQYAHSGNAMAGLATYVKPGLPGTPNYRELIGVHLTQSLLIGVKYFVTMYANQSFYNNVAIASNKLGLRFSTVPYDSCCPSPINNFAHVYTDSILQDSVSWVKVQGTMIADSAYEFITIGNFFDDSNTDTIILSSANYNAAYYYIDDVCVSTDSLYCELWTGVQITNPKDNVTIFPNPASDFLSFTSKDQILELKILNSIGQVCFSRQNIFQREFNINTFFLSNGFYFVQVKTFNEIKFYKIQINN